VAFRRPAGSGIHLPSLRDSVECSFDVRHPERQQVAADRIEVGLIPDEPTGTRTFWPPSGGSISVTCGGREPAASIINHARTRDRGRRFHRFAPG
jgi:hypothetical protein